MNRLETRITKMESKSGAGKIVTVSCWPDGPTAKELLAAKEIGKNDIVIVIDHKIIYGPEDLKNDC